MSAQDEAHAKAMAWLEAQGGEAEIDLHGDEPIWAACAVITLLDMARSGVVVHERVSDTVARFRVRGRLN